MSKRKILFLTESYPDTRKSATTLCAHRVLRAFLEDGKYEVHCICYKYPTEKYHEIYDSIYIDRVKRTCFEKFKYWSLVNKHSWYSKLRKFQKFITIPFYPLICPIQYRKYWRKAIKLNKREHYDVVISQNYYYDTLMTGCKLKKQYPDIKHFPILWDPVKGQMITEKLPSFFTNKRIDNQERLLTQYSDNIISMQSMKHYYGRRDDYAVSKRIFLDFPGIIKPHDDVDTPYLNLLEKDKINIIYSGLLTVPQRSPEYIVELFNLCKFADRINLIFFCRGNASDVLEKLKKTFKGNIVVHDYIPLKELHTLFHHSDYLLNISDKNPNMTPSKIFEYMSYGKPIISSYVTEGDSAQRYLEKYSEACIIDQKKQLFENVGYVNDFLTDEHNPQSFEKIQLLFPLNTPEIFVKTIDSIL